VLTVVCHVLLMTMSRFVLLLPRFIRKVLDEAGAQAVKIISKIESWHGVTNFDDILAVTGKHDAVAVIVECLGFKMCQVVMTSWLPQLGVDLQVLAAPDAIVV
jgi:hypothetical protein